MENTGRLAGKVALVTGGSRGIGAEITRRLAAEGADVGFTYLSGKAEAAEVAERVRSLGRRAFTVGADLAEPGAAAAITDAVTGEFGRLDILVNNAGITHWGSVARTSLADFDRLVAVNARGPFLMMAAVADRLADGGRIVNISSGVTSTALAGIGLYSGVKAFLDQVTRVAAVEFATRRITVNAVAPGSTATGPFAGLTADQKVAAASSFGIGRIGNRRIPQPWSPSSPPPRPGLSPGRSSTSSAGSTARSAGQRRRADAAGRLICCATGARRDMTLAWE